MKTSNKYRKESLRIHSQLIKDGKYREAGRLFRALLNGIIYITINLSDTDWSLSDAFGKIGNRSIRIQ